MGLNDPDLVELATLKSPARGERTLGRTQKRPTFALHRPRIRHRPCKVAFSTSNVSASTMDLGSALRFSMLGVP